MQACKPAVSPVPATDLEQMPRASIIVVNYNGREYLTQCLCSLLDEDHRDYEIIVVDNASTDGSAEHVEERFPEVTVIRNETNYGFGQGNNLAVQRANGEYLAFLNPDATVEPGWLKALMEALQTDPQAGLATSKILLLADPGRINTCGNDVHFTGLTLCRGMGAGRHAFAELEEVSAVSGAAFVARKDVFETLGGFDESFFLYMEDTDLSLRARLAGCRCLYAPQSVVHHDYSLHFGPRKTFYQERNRYLMLLKCLRWRTLLVLLPALVMAEAVTWGFVLLRERRRAANKLRAYAWIVQHWGQVMESRRRTQALRRVRDRDLIAAATHRLDFEQIGNRVAARLAHLLFDLPFFVLHRLALGLIRW